MYFNLYPLLGINALPMELTGDVTDYQVICRLLHVVQDQDKRITALEDKIKTLTSVTNTINNTLLGVVKSK